MKRIVIIGSSSIGVSAAQQIREKDKEASISIITFESYLPYDSEGFFEKLSNKGGSADISYKIQDFYKQHKIDLFLEKKISRINFQRKKIYTDDKVQIEYDELIITESPKNLFPQIKGTNKNGVYAFSKLTDVDQIVLSLPLIDSVIVQSGHFHGLRIAASLISWGKEVLIVNPFANFFAQSLNPEMAIFVNRQIEQKGIRLIDETRISEVLGDSHVKAVRLQTEKVIASQDVIFAEAENDLRLFQGLNVNEANQIIVDDRFRTNQENVFAIGNVCDLTYSSCGRQSWGQTQRACFEAEAKVVADVISGVEAKFTSPSQRMVSVRMQELVITLIGQTSKALLKSEESEMDLENLSAKAIFREGSRLVGALLVNRESEQEALCQAIESQASYPETANL